METTAGLAILVAWVLGLPVLWKTIARKGHSGVLRSNAAIEAAMIAHIALLLTGITLVLLGLHDEF
ncbi:MAG: hypothetical protein AB7O45_15505 [Alphaproteobacteria bacterium]